MRKKLRGRRVATASAVEHSPGRKKKRTQLGTSPQTFQRERISPKNETNHSSNGTHKCEGEVHSELQDRIKPTQSMEINPGPSLNNKSGALKRRKIDPTSPVSENLPTPSELLLQLSDDERESISTCSTENGTESLNENAQKSTRNPSSKKRKEISLDQRIKVMHFAEKFSERQTALAFGISKTAVNAIKKNKLEIMALYEANKKTGTSRCRRIRTTNSEDVNNKTWKWLLQMFKMNDHVTNKQLRQKALLYAQKAGVSNFTASQGWLEAFKKRFGITLAKSVTAVKGAKSVRAYLEARKSMHNAYEQTSNAEMSKNLKCTPSPMIHLKGEVPGPVVSKILAKSTEELLI